MMMSDPHETASQPLAAPTRNLATPSQGDDRGAPGPAAGAAAVGNATCLNCGAPLHGRFCHACGQPVKGMIRPLSSMLHDVVDTIFNIDSRIFHTLLPLYFRPGQLSNEYFAGRRTRYVSPFRLYFFLSVFAFFVIQFGMHQLQIARYMSSVELDDGAASVSTAMTPEEVVARRDAKLRQMQAAEKLSTQAIAATPAPPEVTTRMAQGMEKAAQRVRRQADERLAWLKQVEAAKARGVPPPPDPNTELIDFNDTPWDPQTNPVRIGWLPDFANARINAGLAHARDNLPRIRKDPSLLVSGALAMLPQVLFVLMPLFALLLKLFYLFKRRLYMEHLIVALHSHAFIFLSLLLLALTMLALDWSRAHATWLQGPLGLATLAIGWWMPLYLLLMQKKVYRQGWMLTCLKYALIGIFYSVMVSIGIGAAFIISLATA